MNEDQMDTLGGKAVEMLMDFLGVPGEMTDDQQKTKIASARIAATVLSSCTRFEQVRRASDAMNFMMARELASDQGQLQRYMALTMPESRVTKALNTGSPVLARTS